jgi:hypothetical protein
VAAGFVEQAAIIAGWPAHAIDVILSRRLPEYLSAMSLQQRSEMDAAHAAIHRAAKAYKAGSNVRRRTSDIEEIEFSPPSSHEINTNQAAEMLGLTPRQVRRLAAVWASDGLARQSGRTWFIDRDAVVAYQDQQGRRLTA